MLNGPVDFVPSVIYDTIDETKIFKAALQTEGSAGPSGLDAHAYRRILCSKSFQVEGKELREEIAMFAKNLLKDSYDSSLLEAYTSCRLIPLNKNPGVRPIGVGEVLRRLIGKVISWEFKTDFMEAATPLQTCAGYGAGAEAAIHSMRSIFDQD